MTHDRPLETMAQVEECIDRMTQTVARARAAIARSRVVVRIVDAALVTAKAARP